MGAPPKRVAVGIAAAVIAVAAPLLHVAGPASAVARSQSALVSADPANSTPDVLDGSVHAIVQVGNTVIAGGSFSRVSTPGGAAVARSNLFAFDATTGAIESGFAPQVDGQVNSLATDGHSVYVGGNFRTVDGAATRSLARLSIDSGSAVGGFAGPAFNAQITGVALAGGHLIVGGDFTHVGTAGRGLMASLNPATGALDTFVNVPFTGVHAPYEGKTRYSRIVSFAVSPDGARLVALGSFTAVAGQNRQQIAMLDLSGGTARLANWYTPRYEPVCDAADVDVDPHAVDFAPDGSYVVVGSTGTKQPDTLCDSVARFETAATGTGVQPSWVDYTGGDSIYAVAAVGPVVYVGGHNEYLNNTTGVHDPGRDEPGQGAVRRPGIGAISAADGLPYDWNPTRVRGHAVYALVPTATGLYVGDDTDRIGGEYHAKLAYFPLAGGKAIASTATAALPGDVTLLGAGGTDEVLRRHFTGTAAGPPASVPTGGTAWSQVRGGFRIGSVLYTGQADGTFSQRSISGTTYGAPSPITASDAVAPMQTWHSEVASTTGMAYADGRLYYTRAGVPGVHYRYFVPESGVVGADEFTVAGSNAVSGVEGMFVSGSSLYYATAADGNLHRVAFAGSVVKGAPVTVSGPKVDGADWRARALVL